MFTCRISDHAELRPLEKRLAPELFALVDANRAYLRRWMPWLDGVKDVEAIEKFIQTTLDQHARNNGIQAGVWLDGKLAGVMGHHGVDWVSRRTSMGYWLAESAQGRGVMTEACRALIEHSFGEMGLNRVEIRCATANAKSRAIPQRLGFQLEGVSRQAEWLYDHFVDHEIWGLLAERWNPRK